MDFLLSKSYINIYNSSMTTNLSQSIPVLGLALVLSFLAGKWARRVRIPQVTAYIIVGVILGPSAFNLLTAEMAESFYPINQLAFGLILFNIGGEFDRDVMKRINWLHIKYSSLLALLIFVFATLICFAFSYFTGMNTVQRIVASTFLGLVAIAAAPPTTVLVMKELEAKGPFAHIIMVYLVVGTIISIVGSHAAFYLFQDWGIWSGGHGHYLIQFLILAWSVIGSLIIGTILGLLLSYWEQKERDPSELLLGVICAILLGQTLAYYIQLEPLLVSLSMGFALVNSSPVGHALHARIKNVGLSIYAIFFVLAGAHIHLQQNLKMIGILGIGYLVARSVGIFVSARLAGRLIGEDEKVQKYMGFAILSHAGAAIAIVTKLHGQTDPSAISVVEVVLASIFVFEIAGPLALRQCLIKVCEVSHGSIFTDVTARMTFGLGAIFRDFVQNVGLLRPDKSFQLNAVSPLVIQDILGIEGSASLGKLYKFIESHHQPIYPVIDEEHRFEGIISMDQFRDAIAEPYSKELVLAHQLIGTHARVLLDATLEDAVSIFHQSGLHVLPVVQTGTEKLVGILEYKDVVLAMK
jgi:Kef-type K+ transport system membrane component KefB